MNTKFRLMSLMAFLTIISVLSGCNSENEPDAKCYMEEAYIIQCPDTTVSADEHDLEFYICGTVHESIQIPEDFTVAVNNWEWNAGWALDYPGCNHHDNTQTIGETGEIHSCWDWMDLHYEKSNGKPTKVKVHLSENNTGHDRGIRIYFLTNGDTSAKRAGEACVFQKPKVDTTPFEMTIRYHGEIHTSSVHFNENEEYVYHDSEFASLMNYLTDNPNINMLVVDDKIVDYFDIDDPIGNEIFKKLDSVPDEGLIPKSSNHFWNNFQWTRATGFEGMKEGCLSYFAVFDNDSFKGTTKITTEVTNFYNMYNLPNLKNYSINDKITSLAVGYFGEEPNVCSVLTLWEDTDYNHGDLNRSKHRISFVASYYNRMISRPNLKDIKCLNSSSSWNDKASALSCHFGYYDTKLADY